MKRRECLVGLGVAIAVPRQLSAQHALQMLIGFLNSGTPNFIARYVPAFSDGLADKGYVVGQDVFVEYRSAAGDSGRLSALLAELTKLNVSIVATFGLPAALAAKATAVVPVVFATGADPVGTGLVATLSKPGGNLTGISLLSPSMATKQIEVLHELMPKAEGVGVIVNPRNRIYESQLDYLRAAAQEINLRLLVTWANAQQEVEEAYASLTQQQAGAVIVPGDPLLYSRLDQFVALQSRYRLPTVLEGREFTELGGLMNYGPNTSEAFRTMGHYVARILNGEKPANLPVEQPTKFEMILNLRTAKALGLQVPLPIVARADEVIE